MNHENIHDSPAYQENEQPRDHDPTCQSIFERLRTYDAPALALSAALAAPLSVAEQPRPIELPPEASWFEGTSIIRQHALTGEHEVAGKYVLRTDGSGQWMSVVQGEDDYVDQETREFAQKVEDEMKEGAVERVCSMHSHPVHAAALHNMITEGQRAQVEEQGEQATLSLPPSEIDIDRWKHRTSRMWYRQDYTFDPDTQHIDAVVDPGGVWYYRPRRKEDIAGFPNFVADLQQLGAAKRAWDEHSVERIMSMSEHDMHEIAALAQQARSVSGGPESLQPQNLAEAQSVVVGAVLAGNPEVEQVFYVTDKGRKLNEERKQLQKEHAENNLSFIADATDRYVQESVRQVVTPELYREVQEAFVRQGSMVRYVPFAQLAHEPVCAGVDFTPSDYTQSESASQ